MHRPLLLGHRGAPRLAPENTLAAFDRALADGCDGFECDVRCTADGRGLICHDASFHGLTIARSTYQQVQARSAAAGAVLGVACIEEVLARYAQTAFLDIELKDRGLEDVVAAAWREHRPRRALVSSFLPEVLAALSCRAPDIPLGLICRQRRLLDEWHRLPVEYVIARHNVVSRSQVNDLHQAGKQIFVWTVNDEAVLRRLVLWGVDGIISDDTELLQQKSAAASAGAL